MQYVTRVQEQLHLLVNKVPIKKQSVGIVYLYKGVLQHVWTAAAIRIFAKEI